MKLGKFIFLSPYLLTILIISGAILPLQVNAVSPESVLVDMVPANPAPNENVTITLSSYASNLDSVLIVWSVDGKIASSEIGKKVFSVDAPNVGIDKTVSALISLPDGDIEKTMILRPSKMILLWQANDSYVPPFYKGKALPTPSSQVKVVAMPEIRIASQTINPNNMTYAWKQDYSNDQEASGYGKNYYIYTNDYLDDSNNISVTASTIDQQYSSTANIDIGTTQPKIVFYKNDLNLGTLWEQALTDGHKIIGSEILEAAPYFISPANIIIPLLTWAWSINDNSVSVTSGRNNLLPLQAQEGISGTSKIKLDIENKYKIFETASKSINVQF